MQTICWKLEQNLRLHIHMRYSSGNPVLENVQCVWQHDVKHLSESAASIHKHLSSRITELSYGYDMWIIPFNSRRRREKGRRVLALQSGQTDGLKLPLTPLWKPWPHLYRISTFNCLPSTRCTLHQSAQFFESKAPCTQTASKLYLVTDWDWVLFSSVALLSITRHLLMRIILLPNQ